MTFHHHAIWATAFRPMYLCASIYGVCSILLWGFGFHGTAALPHYLWHAHEMIYGYAGAIIVGFLHTAVPNWTGLPPRNGRFLMVLTALWLLARASIYFSQLTVISGICGTLFFWIAAWEMARMLIKTNNRHNYIAAFALFLFGGSHLAFHLLVLWQRFDLLLNGLLAGLMIVAGFIGLIGSRVIPFFIARRLNVEQVNSPKKWLLAALLLPLMAAVLLLFPAASPLAGASCLAAGVLGLVQVVRWHHKNIWSESMLWILCAGYALTAAGLLFLGLYCMALPISVSLGVHLIAVGGIGSLTVGMMARTAAGHTGRAIYPAPKGLTAAFVLMIAAACVRSLTVFAPAAYYPAAIRLSAALFALSLAIYCIRYAPWLIRPRLDGRAG